jgi:hypothetical protein
MKTPATSRSIAPEKPARKLAVSKKAKKNHAEFLRGDFLPI